MAGDWQTAIANEWKAREAARPPQKGFPLVAQGFDSEEIVSIVDSLLSGRLTMDSQVTEFEEAFARWVGAPYACFVNSGSSANLLAVAVASNPARSKHLRPGDEVLVPAVCWSTSVWPILQMGLKPVFVDVDPHTLNVTVADLERRITPRTRGMVAVHILGNCADLDQIQELAKKHDWIWMEDTCESLGSRYRDKILGTFSAFGTYSFYYSHHITTGEGGMVVCQTLEDYDLLRCLRAHGWSRLLSDRAEVEQRHSDIDPRFLFVNVGYNLRPMEVQAAMGLCQMRRVDQMNQNRIANRDNLIAALKAHPRWDGQFEFTQPTEKATPSWFGFPALLRQDLVSHLRPFLQFLSSRGIENRPIVSGNFTRQPALALHSAECNPLDYPGAERVHHTGFFIGVHTDLIEQARLLEIADALLSYEF